MDNCPRADNGSHKTVKGAMIRLLQSLCFELLDISNNIHKSIMQVIEKETKIKQSVLTN